ncbi:MAG: GTPase Era [Actinobacteria bacterium]|nr:GTPase Era [Actinomycetota bacterium]
MTGTAAAFRSGFVTVVGRPNVGKSTLVNRLVGQKVSIVSDRPQTTRSAIRGVRTTPDAQIVFIDTPGLHKPRTLLGERTNKRARDALDEVDVICVVVEANAAYGPGDRFAAELAHGTATPAILVVNKLDAAAADQVLEHLATAAAALGDFDAYVPLSALTGEGVDGLVDELEQRLPEGPQYFPDGVVTDQPETFLAAELVREQLLRVTRDELPHSIAVTVEVDDDPDVPDDEILRLLVTIRVERDSQKGIVIGKRGAVLKEALTAARHELEALLGARVFMDTKVKVEKDWQRRARSLDRLGFDA